MFLQRFDLTAADPDYRLSIKQTLTIKPQDLFVHARRRDTKIVDAAPALRGYTADVETLDSAAGKMSSDGAVVIVTSSDEGQPPDNARTFVQWLRDQPDGALDGVRYAVFYVGQFLSRKRTAQALAELFGTAVSEATVVSMARRAARGLTGFLDTVADRLADAEVVGVDETSLRVAGGLAWVHCARTDRYTLITCHPKRGRVGTDAAGVLPRFRGIAVHDAWAPYDTYVDVSHQLCCAYAVRELHAAVEAAPTRNGWHWASQAADALVAIQKLVPEAATADTVLDPEALAVQIHTFRCATQIGAAQTRARTSPIMRKHHALARRLVERHDDYLRFAHDPRVPADNNGSERDIRMIKLRQKVSGCLRTLTGAQQFCAIRSYLATAAKHGQHFFHTLVMLAEGRPWLPALP